jgi:Flp pilus assembly pilin Flp
MRPGAVACVQPLGGRSSYMPPQGACLHSVGDAFDIFAPPAIILEGNDMSMLGWRRGQAGQGLAEYALILALIAIVAVVALLFLGGVVSTILSNVGKKI